MKNPRYDPRTVDIEDQRGDYDFLSRYMQATDNYKDRIQKEGGGTEAEYNTWLDAAIRNLIDYQRMNKGAYEGGVYPESNGIAPDAGKFRDHKWDNYILGRLNVRR